MKRLGFSMLATTAFLACTEPPPGRVPAPPPAPSPPKPPASAAPADALGERPPLGAPKTFAPPAPTVFKTANGITVWLVERHTLPIVSVAVVLPSGSAVDPPEKPGLAHITADMLDEGAGTRNAVELSSAINDLGASLGTGVQPDGGFASLTVLKKNFSPAFSILSDVVVRPRFDPKEWKRVSDLWKNGLKKRADDPSSVSRVVTSAALYGPKTPYGHPSDGLIEGSAKIDLAATKAFYAARWRPDQALLVAAGDITRDELTQEINRSLASWKATGAAPPSVDMAQLKPITKRPRLVLVDRPDAPQSVIAVVRDGVAATDPTAPLLDLVNTALGGSFTSRLNQNLREDHGWTYGARSGFAEVRGQGSFVARAAVRTDVTGVALKEMLGELSKMASAGMTPDELAKVRAQDRAELVQTYETGAGVTRRLGELASLGLPPDFDAAASRARQTATLEQLGALAAAHVDPKSATIVVVGPKVQVVPQLAALGLGEPELWNPEGFPNVGTAAAPGGKPSKN